MIPSSWISTDPSEYQLHVGASSLQFTPLIFYRVQVREQRQPWHNLKFVLSDTFLCWFRCLFWIIVLMKDPNMVHYKISNRGTRTPWQMFAFASVTDEIGMVPLVFGTENSKSIFHRNKLKWGFIWVQHNFTLSYWLSEMTWNTKCDTTW